MVLDAWMLIIKRFKMAKILNIETSSKHCSVALAIDGEIVRGFESKEEMDHSISLAPFVEDCMKYLNDNNLKLDAVCVTDGPGSYTGIRIGLSMAKGLAFSLDIPLITLSSLEVLAVRAIFTYHNFYGDETIVPMIDARRMEVYTTVFDSGLKRKMDEKALVLNENSYFDIFKDKKILFIGDGSDKFKELYGGDNAIWIENGMPHAKFMVTLAEKRLKESKFADVAYSSPRYLKEYQATQSKPRL